jgi:putative endonuclease
MFSVYVLQSLRNGRFYIGSTNNIERRLQEHNQGKSKYTKLTAPFSLIYQEQYFTASEARKREYYLKRLKSRKYIISLINCINNTGV